ncbi:tRNA epoxyqueuosine(34) reductase QueG [Candidatus Sumerlaeota bacterium]|nr:tRNA epoxyqueuosine(34) reductase QueG [Candidatus Sumerlaeota bacterium]
MTGSEYLREEATRLGFDWFGVARAEVLQKELEEFKEWLSEGRHGEMQWLARDPERRCDPTAVLDGCKSVIIVSLNYLREPLGAVADVMQVPLGFGRVSKYAQTRDYHRVFENLLKKLAMFVQKSIAPGATTKTFVDYGPLMERAWAVRAGLGFIGKHTLLIHPKEGSFHFLGALLTTAELDPTGSLPLARDGCGDCRRCIDACPTGAITEPWKLDARRCLSYLTIEKQGAIDDEFHDRFAANIFGCDICQDVCPYNQSRAKPRADSPLGPALVEPRVPLADLIGSPDVFLERFSGKASPLKRAGAASLRRNAMIVAGTNGDDAARRALHAVEADTSLADSVRMEARKALTNDARRAI